MLLTQVLKYAILSVVNCSYNKTNSIRCDSYERLVNKKHDDPIRQKLRDTEETRKG